MGKFIRFTKARPTECPYCHGLGVTRMTAPVMECAEYSAFGAVEIRTLSQGSGCPRCHGTGQIAKASAA